jgi:hypothetical protein
VNLGVSQGRHGQERLPDFVGALGQFGQDAGGRRWGGGGGGVRGEGRDKMIMRRLRGSRGYIRV